MWLDRLYRHLADELKAEPLIITVRDARSGHLAAIFPLVVRRRHRFRVVEFADFGISDYCAPVCDPGAMPALLADRTVPKRIRTLLKPNDLIFVQKIRAESLPFFDLLGKVRALQLPFTAHATRLFSPFAAWREAGISPSQRRFLDTKRKWLTKRGTLTVSAVTSGEGFQQVLENIQRFRDHRFRATGAFDILTKEAFARFYREVAHESLPARGYLMKLNGTIIAAAFGLLHGKRLHFILSGFDFLNYRNASLGLLLIEDIIADCIARGEETMDLTIGDQAYKREFGTHDTAMYSIWSGLSLRGKLAAFLLSRSDLLRQLTRRFVRR
ncbi:MAG: GNAT family N-acetyltransferase [Bradyrhizobiaceae bacterium]|nr:MAG: GNAT family N-acetyltransferase [Bradyrhizobiaceae bacterium]